jgi:hypothetical protein
LLFASAPLLLEPRQFGALSLEARGFGGGGSLLARIGGGLRGGGGGGLFLGRGLNVRGFSATANRRFGGGRSGNRFGHRSGRAAPTRGRRRRSLLLRANALLTLPPGADTRHLIIREQAHMAAKWNVHLAK